MGHSGTKIWENEEEANCKNKILHMETERGGGREGGRKEKEGGGGREKEREMNRNVLTYLTRIKVSNLSL